MLGLEPCSARRPSDVVLFMIGQERAVETPGLESLCKWAGEAASRTLSPGARVGPYEILALAGAGGMGEVYKARDTRLGRTVAIKVLTAAAATDPDRLRRFEHEARAVAALNHPHICTLYDIGSTPSTGSGQASSPQAAGVGASSSVPGPPLHYLVMEFLEGQTLAERLAKGPLPLEQALEFGAGHHRCCVSESG